MNLSKDSKGFSILEVLIAICLLSIGIMGLATLQSRGIRGNDLGNRTSQALALAQDQLEQLINSGSGTNYPLTPTASTPDPYNPIDETGSGGGIFTRVWQIQDNTPVNGSQTITVTVTWNDIIGQHRVNVDGVISSDGY
ncbi:MAG: prepilin-type N-terminal cleavage/methylation domain-containing protein [Deltaproteobacteria bacterium]|nr:prepilin-type N-terminal cleavage/methylation domain-containing protein [Deltaproteobacteria bacterium]